MGLMLEGAGKFDTIWYYCIAENSKKSEFYFRDNYICKDQRLLFLLCLNRLQMINDELKLVKMLNPPIFHPTK